MASSEIIIILDRSGSMNAIREATVQGINDFITDAQKVPGECFWTLVLFDDYASAKGANEAFPYVVWDRRPGREIPKLEVQDFTPRGGTALIDATCVMLNSCEEKWLKIAEKDRPRMMIVIVTDGEENSSREYNRDKLRETVSRVKALYGWEFTFLGANIDAFSVSNSYGMAASVNMKGVGAGGQSYIPMEATARGFTQALCSGAVGAVAWLNQNTGGCLVSPVVMSTKMQCLKCGASFPVQVNFSGDAETPCPTCGHFNNAGA